MAKHGAVAAGHPATAAAAREILEDGGNAFDAALAAMCAACVVEPVLCSLAGGGFLLAAGPERRPVLFDFFVETPMRQRPTAEIDFYPIHADFGTATQEFHIGLGAMATPGIVRGLFDVHRACARLPIDRVLAPAVRLAREGVPLRPIDGYIFEVVAPVLTATEGARALYCGPDGLLKEKDVLKQPDLADSLSRLAAEGDRLFYEGEMAAQIVDLCQIEGGHLTREDLTRYQTVRRDPLECNFRGARILTNPSPSSGGLLIAFALDLLSRSKDLRPFGSAAHLGWLARTMTLTNEARIESRLHEAMGEAEEEAAARRLFDPQLLARYAADVAKRPKARRGTTHVSVVDDVGNMAALSMSNGEGCGRILPGTGIMLNNMLGEEDLNPHGFHRWPQGVRLSSMMAPSLAYLEGGTIAALGSGGSNRIRTAILQVLINLIEFRMPTAEAVKAPRLHVERGLANIESGFTEEGVAAAKAECEEILAWPAGNLFFGGVHTAARRAEGRFEAAGDLRRGGVGVAF